MGLLPADASTPSSATCTAAHAPPDAYAYDDADSAAHAPPNTYIYARAHTRGAYTYNHANTFTYSNFYA